MAENWPKLENKKTLDSTPKQVQNYSAAETQEIKDKKITIIWESKDKLWELAAIAWIKALETSYRTLLENMISVKKDFYGKIIEIITGTWKIKKEIFENTINLFLWTYPKIVNNLSLLYQKWKINWIYKEKIRELIRDVDKIIDNISSNSEFRLINSMLCDKLIKLKWADFIRNEWEKLFYNKYKSFNDKLCSLLWLSYQTSEMVIERESEFNQSVKWKTKKWNTEVIWWNWYMQLTSAPFKDMMIWQKWWRWDIRYIEHFQKIFEWALIDKIEDEKIKSIFIRIKLIISENPINKAKWNAEITKLSLNKLNPFVNLFVWNIQIAALKKDAESWKSSAIEREIRNLNELNSKSAIKKFNSLLAAKWIYLANPDMMLKELKRRLNEKDENWEFNNKELREQFYVLAKYNANWKERTYYAAAITAHYIIKTESIKLT